MSDYFPTSGVISMKISALLTNDHFEERRRILQRKEANDAYKKNALYTQSKKNPMLKILEDLLSGKTEKELFEKEQPLLNEERENYSAATIEINDDNQSLIKSPYEEMPTEMMLQSAGEIVSDEENVNRISEEHFDFINPELLAPNASSDRIVVPSINQSFESITFEKMYTKAAAKYSHQMQMARNGFKLDQSIYSYIA